MPSQTGHVSDANMNKFRNYLHRLANSCEMDVHITFLDHPYSRPWNWKPEHVYMKPIKKLFFPKPPNTQTSQDENAEIDVVSCDGPEDCKKPIPIDFTRPQHIMDEFQRLAAFAKPECHEDWEERINKTWWTNVQSATFAKAMRVLSSERLARLVRIGSPDEPILRRVSVDTATRRFRETLASTGWDVKVAQWLHLLLFEHLPQEYLSIYLDILQTLRTKIPHLVEKIIAAQPTLNGRSGPITWETLGSVLKRSWDPVAVTLNANKAMKLPGNPILVIAPCRSGVTISSRQHRWISLLGSLGTVVNVPVHLGADGSSMTMISCIEQLVLATRSKIQDVRGDCPGRPIILVGFNSGAALACQVAQLEQVAAIVCLGFPFMTAEGKRGTPDDTLMDLRSPVLFVIGQNATLVRPENMESLRVKMMVETGLVVVGNADDQLRVTTAKKISAGVTQSMVDRCILEEVGDFVGNVLLQPQPLPLRTPTLTTNAPSASTGDGRPKKDTDRRKNSTSSSVESEPHSPCPKKSRPNTPISSTQGAFQSSQVTASTPLVLNLAKRKSRAGNYKTTYIDSPVAKSSAQGASTNNGSGGITVNIGSMASLGSVGNISLGPSQANSGNIPNQPKIVQTNVTKVSRGVPSVSNTPGQGRIRTVLPVTNRSCSRVSSNSQLIHKQGITDGNLESKTVNHRYSGSQNFSTLMQSGKSGMVVTSGTPIGKTSTASNTAQSSRTPITTITPKAINHNREDKHPRNLEILHRTSNHPLVLTPRGRNYVGKCSEELEITPIPRSYTSTSMVVSGSQGSLNLMPKQPKTMTKVTIPAMPKQHVTTTATKQTLESETSNYDIGNIMDIPVVFANDDESLEKETPPRLEKSGPTQYKKMVLIGNKHDKRPVVPTIVRHKAPMVHHQQQQHLTVQNREPVTIARAGVSQLNTKYTKIVVAKRNAAVAGLRKDPDRVVMTKRPRVSSTHLYPGNANQDYTHFQNEPLEIEDAIKTNIIEKKAPIVQESGTGVTEMGITDDALESV